jgi:hypothetical protein
MPSSKCLHGVRTVKSPPVRILKDDSQEILGKMDVRICLNCAHVKGTFSNGSMFYPVKFDFEGDTWELAVEGVRKQAQELSGDAEHQA